MSSIAEIYKSGQVDLDEYLGLPKATKVLMCRSGETDWNKSRKFQGSIDIPLNAEGHEQAQLLASALIDQGVTAVWTSPMLRACGTAAKIADECRVPLQVDTRLREMDLGIMQGVAYRDVAKDHPHIWEAWKNFRALPPEAEAECDDNVKQRMEATFVSILYAHPGETVAVVGHAGTMRCLLKDSGSVGNASITTITVGPAYSWRANEVDCVSHLPGPTLTLGDLRDPYLCRPLLGKPITTIMLCRHGESLGNLSKQFQGTIDLPLSSRGHVQAQCIGNFLKPLGLTALFTSPQKRASETAKEISAIVGVNWMKDARLSERNLGKLQGCRHDDVKSRMPHVWQAWKGYLPLPADIGAEPESTVIERLQSVLFEIALNYPGQTVGVVLHGANGRCLLKRSIGNASITTVQVGPGRKWHVQDLGYALHLPAFLANDAIKAARL
jgi:broad specificity phosphatase PhoE